MNQSTGFISKTEVEDSFLAYYNFPMLDVRDPLTLESWYRMRVAFLDFGRKYTYRIFLYASLILPLSTVMVCLLLLQVFNVVTIRTEAFISILFLTISCLAIIIYMIVSGVELNGMFSIHKEILMNNIGTVMKEINETNDNKRLQEVLKMMELFVKKLEQDEILRPVKIMGIVTDSNLFTKVVAVLLSGLFAIIQLLIRGGSTI